MPAEQRLMKCMTESQRLGDGPSSVSWNDEQLADTQMPHLRLSEGEAEEGDKVLALDGLHSQGEHGCRNHQKGS